jgi:hypothetical protein
VQIVEFKEHPKAKDHIRCATGCVVCGVFNILCVQPQCVCFIHADHRSTLQRTTMVCCC